jgi:hypothetical protein
MSLSLLASPTTYPNSIVDFHQSLYVLRLQEAENALSSLVLVALLTYFYTAFGKCFQPGGGLGRGRTGSDHSGKEADEEARQELGSPIYYSSAAAA